MTRALSSSSNLQRRFLCNGSARAESRFMDAVAKGIAHIVESEVADEGTLLHRLDAHPELPRDELSGNQKRALERNAELRQKFMEANRSTYGIREDEPCVVFKDDIEYWLCAADGLPYSDPVTHEGFPGHPDLVYYYPRLKLAIIFDSKFGRIPVTHAAVNFQLKSYFVMVAENFECERVIVAVTQPWVKAPNDFHAAEYTAADLEPCRAEIIGILESCIAPDAKRVPSDDACKYCKAAGSEFCPEYLKMATLQAIDAIDKMTIEELEAAGPELERAVKVHAKWQTRMKFLAKEHPEQLHCYFLRPTGSITSVPDLREALSRMQVKSRLLGLTIDEVLDLILDCSKLSLPQLFGRVAKQLGIDEDKAQVLVKPILGELVVEKEKEPSLKRG